MRHVEAAGLRLSRIGLGTWQFSREWGYGDDYARVTAPALVRRALELGITMIDTAEAYGPGRSERIIGETLGTIPTAARDDLVVATKFLPIAPAEPILAWQVAGSLRRLGTDSLDLLYAHWTNPFVRPRRVMQSVRPLVDLGLVRRVGVSNHSLDGWREAERALRAPVVANQVRFSLASPEPAADLVPYAADADRIVVAYSPLGQGLLTATDGGELHRVTGFRTMDRRHRARGADRAVPLATALREVAAAHAATPAQVALAWVVHHPNTVAIPGARTVEQLEENAAAGDIVLDDAEAALLTAAARLYTLGD